MLREERGPWRQGLLWLSGLMISGGLATAAGPAWAQAPAAATTTSPNAAETVRVAGVTVRLQIHRGGDRLADGTRVAKRAARVDGEAVYRLTRPARAGERIVLLNYTAALAREPIELDEIAVATYADGPFQAAALTVLQVSGAPDPVMRRVGDRGDVEVLLHPGQTEFSLRYQVAVPHRYWPLGCARRRCSLDGAIAPLPSVVARGGSKLPQGRVVDPVHWEVAEVAFAGDPGRDEIVVTKQSLGGDGRLAYPSVYWGPRWRRIVQDYRGVRVEILHMRRRPGNRVPNEHRVQFRRDVAGHALKVAREVIDVSRVAGLELPAGSKLTLLQGPVRTNVAEFHPSSVVFSDQFLQLWPSDRFTQFHTAVVARASLDMVTYGFMTGKHDPSTDLWLGSAMAMALLDVWRVQREHGDEYVSDIFRKLAFVPVVDNFLYTGQATFAAAYFRSGDDLMPVRIHPLYFSHDLPTGRRIHEKWGDLMAPEQRAQIYLDLIKNPRADPKRVAEMAYGHRLDWFFDQWLAPYPDVDYRVATVTSQRTADGYDHKITVARDGPALEPVQVLVRERGGGAHYLVWNGDDATATNTPSPSVERQGERQAALPSTLELEAKEAQDDAEDPDAEETPAPAGGEAAEASRVWHGAPPQAEYTFGLQTARPLRSVMLDPRERLVETPMPPRTNVDPLYNNRYPAQARFVYTGIGLEVAAAEFSAAQTAAARLQAISGRVLFEASQRRDLRYTGHLQFSRDRDAKAAVGTGVSVWLGDKINRRRRRTRVRVFTDLQWLNFRSLDTRGGVRVRETVALVDDTRKFSLWPDRGHRLALTLTAGQTIRTEGLRDHRYNLSGSASWVQIWSLAHQHTLATNVELAVMAPLGSAPEYRNLLRGGGLGGLGAYGGNELFGRMMGLAQLEYRHVYVNNLDFNLAHIAWLRGLGGALSGGVVSLSSCDSFRGFLGRDSYYGQVGYALTAFLQLLGVTPQFIRIDVSVPLVRRDTLCLGNMHPEYLGERQGLEDGQLRLPPVGFNLMFLQPF